MLPLRGRFEEFKSSDIVETLISEFVFAVGLYIFLRKNHYYLKTNKC